MKNQEGQTALDLATAEDVKSLLQDAMVQSGQPLPPPTFVTPPVVTPTVETGEQHRLFLIASKLLKISNFSDSTEWSNDGFDNNFASFNVKNVFESNSRGRIEYRWNGGR